MEIVFEKLPGNEHRIVVRGRAGAVDVMTAPQPSGPNLPHDLVHAAVEAALRIDDGFWGAIARGATFRGFVPVDPSVRHRRSGLKVLRRKGDDVLRAELVVGWVYRVWSGQRTAGRGLVGAPIDEATVAKALPAVDDAYQRWLEVPEGGALVWTW